MKKPLNNLKQKQMKEKINFALALNKLHKDNPQEWELLAGKEIKKLSDRFLKKTDTKGNVIHKGEMKNFEFKGINFDALEKNQESAIKSLCGENYDYIDFEPDWRFIIGLGGASVYNTGITLHHIYGIPYIPATSIKGSVRSWKIQEDEFQEDNEDAEGLAIQNEEFCKVFGCPKEIDLTKNGFKKYKSALKHNGESYEFEGNMIFFDAFPLKPPILKVDVMTPHYQDYYGDNNGKTPPADYFSLKPIMFLTVEKTTFRMYFGVKKEANEGLVNTTKNWIDNALFHRGIGAKTAIGYGYNKNTHIEENKNLFKEKVEPNFFQENRNKLNRNRSYNAEGIITKIGKDNQYKDVYYASVYIKENDIRENIKINRIPNKLDIGTVIKVTNIKVGGNEKFDSATFNGEKK